MHTNSSARICAAVLLGGIAFVVAGCATQPQVAAGDVADRVVSKITQRLGVVPKVDCGSGTVALTKGAQLKCRVTDPDSGVTYDASVRLAPLGHDALYDVDLSVKPPKK